LATPDVTILGAGIFGLSIGWECARRGARVRLIDPRGAGGGASGGVVGALAPHTPERWNAKKEFQLQSLLMAGAFWAGVEEASGLTSGYGRTGRLQPVAHGRALDLARERAQQAAGLWRGEAEWRVRPATDFGPWAPHSPSGWLIHDTLSARIDPHRACLSLAGALAARGAGIAAEGRPEGAVIHATGYEGLETLSRELGRPVGAGVKGQAALLRFDAREQPQLYAEALHVVPHDNGTVAIGSTTEREFTRPDTTDEQVEELIRRATAAVPLLAEAPVLATWAGVRPRARSRAPMLGPYPGRPGEFIANGGFKIGFGMAPKVAQVMADLVLEGRDAIPDAFRVEASL